MTKLIIQIPCFNEAETLPETLVALPRRIDGIDQIEVLVIDDGSHDGTAEVARRFGAHHIVRHRRNRGLAAAFQSGLDAALAAGADIIVNTDADGQYEGADIARLVAPVIAHQADIVIGDRGVANNAHFGPFKRLLQHAGSSVVRRLSRTDVTDAVSGFRAISRAAAQRITITTEFSYTTDMLIQAGRKRLKIVSVPIRTHAAVRPSRLFTSIPQFITRQLMTMARAYATYNPLRTFALIGTTLAVIGLLPILRFLYFWATGDGDGHVQSLVLGGSLLVLGVVTGLLGVLADQIGTNRKLLEEALFALRRLEDERAAAPRDDLPGDSPAASPARPLRILKR
ncbi:glycosyltransferase family 2 protein [Novosphingobium sp.]|jgi:glycosyltransferase involved in cell wall biosynthesis|uniref:glycosyltransferase family 2 protein n=1 Tax=Novosphingobium sp. TaxID=1874826 RepID=UPI0022C60BCE|nr:glycosyltransferase family 2 protein [Novosphingobium sp.]MCZ8019656.1 glycosyltransferase family 2 protein [Novosphingobium sp.]MCZ8035471.1 glycosyltransferase family 2 protein [Novosphingobium sp.]MCZ8050785.1 glycosyltransferase family 2 protein [Novosphingobium sp.]MCZ8059131.1 glycosyltransferase family 2 protein [Novosphingobium sp.]MCZ8232577.1 glycosyltransferase family 2 protein [Novosphingobium sp.]